MQTALNLTRRVALRLPSSHLSRCTSRRDRSCHSLVHSTYQMTSTAPVDAAELKPELVAEVDALKKQLAALEV